jgi:hypothetical protein
MGARVMNMRTCGIFEGAFVIVSAEKMIAIVCGLLRRRAMPLSVSASGKDDDRK